MDAAQQDDTRASTAHDPLLIQTITIAPNELIKVRLGRFQGGQPKPEFRNMFHDKAKLESPTAISYQDIAMPAEANTYVLIRTFQSYSQVTQRVSVLFRARTDRERLV